MARNLTPAFVQHCQLGSPTIGCPASRMYATCMETVRSPGFSRLRFPKRSGSDNFKVSPLILAPPAKAGTPYALLFLLLAALCGCATSRPAVPSVARHFDFQKDTFAYPNELVWEYYFDANGKWR